MMPLYVNPMFGFRSKAHAFGKFLETIFIPIKRAELDLRKKNS